MAKASVWIAALSILFLGATGAGAQYYDYEEEDDEGEFVPWEQPRYAVPRGSRDLTPFARRRLLPPPTPPSYRLFEEPERRVAPRAPFAPPAAVYSPTRRIVANVTGQPAGTIVVDTRSKRLFLALQGGRALQYGIGVGREGFAWRGSTRIGRMATWPSWSPPLAMRRRQPYLPAFMAGGPANPLGARALYLYTGRRDTMFRIHGTNERWSIGRAVSSGCIRMLNEDVIDLYTRVGVGTRVVVL